MFDQSKPLTIAGWALTVGVTIFMLRDVSPDLQQLDWVIKANAGLGIPADVVLPIGRAGLVCAILLVTPWTSVLGAILLTGFLGGAVFSHMRVNGDVWDMGENVLIGVMAWAGLWLRDPRLRALLPVRFR